MPEELKINENKLRLSGGSASIPKELKLESLIDFTCKGAEVSGIKDAPNYDGTFDRVFSLKLLPTSEIVIMAEKELIKCEVKKSPSQALRMAFLELFEQQFSGQYQDFQTFYNEQMSKLINGVKERLLWFFNILANGVKNGLILKISLRMKKKYF